MFERLEKIVSIDKLNKLNDITVMIIGVGGVGGYVVEALVRSGIKKFILIDKDIVDITNKNRQIIALDSTIGKEKTDVMKNRILDINKECSVDALNIFLDKDNTYSTIEKYKPDYVIDACDTVTTKLEIIKSCLDLNIKFISSMGTGNKFNPSKLMISDIKKTHTDPLAKIMRKLVKDNNLKGKIMVLWSSEEPVKTNDRTPGSSAFVPSSAGILIASYIFNDIINMEGCVSSAYVI